MALDHVLHALRTSAGIDDTKTTQRFSAMGVERPLADAERSPNAVTQGAAPTPPDSAAA